MKLAIIGDLHGNFPALLALAPMLEQADRLICLGDITGYYCEVNEVIAWLRRMNALCILGNHDHYVLSECPAGVPAAVRFGVDFARRVLKTSHRDWMQSLPLSWGGWIAGRSFLFNHGSPWRPLEDYLYADSPKLSALESFSYDMVAFGQTHRFLSYDSGRPRLLNPGAVGQNRDVGEEAVASAAWVETHSMAVEHLRRAYDPRPVLERARQAGAGEWITRHLVAPRL